MHEHVPKQESTTPRPPKPVHSSTPKDPLAIRTIVISGLPSSIDSKLLWKKVRKYEGAEKVEWPAKINDAEDPTSGESLIYDTTCYLAERNFRTAHVLFSNPGTAQEAVTKLHAHVFKGTLLSVTLKKRLDGLAKPIKAKAQKVSATPEKAAPAPSRASRLIVRNLPFDITEQDLRAVFLPYGPIHSVHIPVKHPEPKQEGEEGSSSQSKPQAKGYAFVWMLSKKDAEKALEGANGTKVHAGLADGLVRHKQLKKKLRREEAKLKQKEKERKTRGKEVKEEGEEEIADEDDASDDEEEENSSERVIAVDWALSKDKWEEAKAKLQSEDAKGAESESESESEGSGDEDEEGSHIGVHDGEDDSSDSVGGSDDDSDEMDLDGEETKPGKPELPQTDTGTTLFVRNVPFEATEDDLRTT